MSSLAMQKAWHGKGGGQSFYQSTRSLFANVSTLSSRFKILPPVTSAKLETIFSMRPAKWSLNAVVETKCEQRQSRFAVEEVDPSFDSCEGLLARYRRIDRAAHYGNVVTCLHGTCSVCILGAASFYPPLLSIGGSRRRVLERQCVSLSLGDADTLVTHAASDASLSPQPPSFSRSLFPPWPRADHLNVLARTDADGPSGA